MTDTNNDEIYEEESSINNDDLEQDAITDNKIETDTERDYFMNAKEALNYGLIDKIIEDSTPIANEAKLHVTFNKNRNIKVTADPMQLERVIKNLINNAIYHSNTKKDITIETGEIPGFITISVTDYGQGIAQNEIGLIFNKYYTASKKFRKIGTGLGLYLSQQIILAHGGEITVESEENTRTEFCIKIPSI